MAEETQVDVVATCRMACKMQHDGEFKYYKDMAIYVKQTLDKKIGGSWHVIVGTNFGSFVTYENACMYLFWLE